MVLCLLAADDEEDVALQIHFTLIQAFCCENDINILRVSNMRRLAEILGGVKPGAEAMDLHCILVTVSVGSSGLGYYIRHGFTINLESDFIPFANARVGRR